LSQARDLIDNIQEEERADGRRCLAVLLNKAQLELTGSKSVGNINSIAFLPSDSKPKAITLVVGAEEETKEEVKIAPKVEDVLIDTKYDWYQNTSHVFLSFKIKKGDIRQSIEVCYGETALTLTNLGVQFANLKLSNQIVNHMCTYTCGLKKIEIKLKKSIENFNWITLEASSATTGLGVGVPTMAMPINTKVPDYPSSSKNKKNWDNIETDCEKELKAEKPEGDGALNDLFKQIYGRADEATRRAMIKSYQTSGGTVLSTNWDEVHTKDYEGKDRPEAPAG